MNPLVKSLLVPRDAALPLVGVSKLTWKIDNARPSSLFASRNLPADSDMNSDGSKSKSPKMSYSQHPFPGSANSCPIGLRSLQKATFRKRWSESVDSDRRC